MKKWKHEKNEKNKKSKNEKWNMKELKNEEIKK